MIHLKTKLILPTLFLCTFLSCNKNTKGYNNIPILDLPESVKIEGKSYNDKCLIGKPMQVELIGNNLLLFQQKRSCIAQKISVHSGRDVGCLGTIGGGPDEYISPYFAGIDSVKQIMYVWDMGLSKIREYRYSISDNEHTHFELVKTNVGEIENQFSAFVVNHISDDLFVAQIFGGEESDMFVLMDKEQSIISKFGKIPLKGITKPLGIRGKLASNNDQFVFVGDDYGYIVSYRISSTGIPHKEWEYFLSEPHYTIKDDGGASWRNENIESFYDVQMNSEYIFALYCGSKFYWDPDERKFPETLLAFDLNGNLLKRFQLDTPCVRFTLSDNNTIYALSIEPEEHIVKYALNAYLK